MTVISLIADNLDLTDGIQQEETTIFEGIMDNSALPISDLTVDADTGTASFKINNVTFTVDNNGNMYLGSDTSGTVVASLADSNINNDEFTAIMDKIGGGKTADQFISNKNNGGLDTTGMTKFEKMLAIMADAINGAFEDIMALTMAMSTGEGIDGIRILADKNIKIDDKKITDMVGSEESLQSLMEFNYYKNTLPGETMCTLNDGILTIEFGDGETVDISLQDNPDFEFAVSSNASGEFEIDNVDIKLSNASSILESPGTLFMIQQLISQMKDIVAALTATGKVLGDVSSTAKQTYARNVSQ